MSPLETRMFLVLGGGCQLGRRHHGIVSHLFRQRAESYSEVVYVTVWLAIVFQKSYTASEKTGYDGFGCLIWSLL